MRPARRHPYLLAGSCRPRPAGQPDRRLHLAPVVLHGPVRRAASVDGGHVHRARRAAAAARSTSWPTRPGAPAPIAPGGAERRLGLPGPQRPRPVPLAAVAAHRHRPGNALAHSGRGRVTRGSACAATCPRCTARSRRARRSPTGSWPCSTAACATSRTRVDGLPAVLDADGHAVPGLALVLGRARRRPAPAGARPGAGSWPASARLYDLRGTLTGLRELLLLVLGLDELRPPCPGCGRRARHLPAGPGDLPAAAGRPGRLARAATGAGALPAAPLAAARREPDRRRGGGVGAADRQPQPARQRRTGRRHAAQDQPGPAARPVPRLRPPLHGVRARGRRRARRSSAGSCSGCSPSARPAHTAGSIEYVEPRFRIGVQSSLGLDSVVAARADRARARRDTARAATVLTGEPTGTGRPAPTRHDVGSELSETRGRR